MGNESANTSLLNQMLAQRILVLDGAMGTMIQQHNLSANDFGGATLEGCNENLVLSRPDVILDIHRKYFEAGADIVETDTFGSTPLVLAEYGLAEKCREINMAAAKLARQAAEEFSTPNKPRFVAGSMGPTTKAITVTGGVTFNELIEHFHQQARALAEGGVDILLVETCQDTRNTKAALIGIWRAFDELDVRLPVMVSGTIEPMGTMLAGQAADAFVVSLMHAELLSVGLNCATGPEFMTDHIRTIHEMALTNVSCYPNAGLPDEEGRYGETPTSLAASLERFVKNGWLNMIGGCCGTTPAHIKAIAEMVDGKQPRRYRPQRKSWYSGIELVEAGDDNRPLIVGERTNEVGSRAFKRLITEEKYEEATEIGRAQVKNGAHIIDVNLENPDRDELADIDRFYEKLIHKVKCPIMIDSTNPKAVERALTYCQGKSILNSINFEDGDEKFDRVIPLIKKYGAAVVIGSIDEDKVQAQAITRERKLAIAQRARKLCTEKWGIPEEDLVFDPLVFPCATGDENYIGSAVETIEGVRLIKEALPRCKTVLGISNVSFGLPAAAREVINSVFLYHATKAGLDLAIVNAEKLERYPSIPDKEKKLAEDLLWNHPPEGYDAPQDYRQQTKEQRAEINQLLIAAVSDHFRGAESRVKKKISDLPLDERLANYIIEGTKEGLIEDLELKRKEGAAPLEIINGPLMKGMEEVGRLFNNNELIVAEVLQSAEAMKAAVAHLEQFMEKKADSTKGKVILATVKGDVHDIGKNLVEIILANNGYKIINLGIKVPPEELIKAYREHNPDAIGLSGLLVKSAQQMVVTATDLRQAGITVPLLVGGAALSDKFTRTRIAPSYERVVIYCKDAMTGLAMMNKLMAGEKIEHDVGRAGFPQPAAAVEEYPETTQRSSRVRILPPLPAPYPDRKVRDVPQLREIWEYINPQMLYVRHLGFKTNFERALAARDPKALELFNVVEEVKAEAAKFMKVKAVWQFFEAEAEGNSIKLFSPAGPVADPPIHVFTFRRQRKPDGLCLSDYINPPRDSICVFVVGAGTGIRERSEQYKARGEYLKSHTLQALAIETAEAAAEWLHRRIREDWEFPDPANMTMLDRFTTKYRGRRYSFGYPACPALEDQAGIWKLLKPEEIGVQLTEGFMMDPEASVSALVLHHPDCTYFGVGETTD
jgi:5-methyltetrahydrofolate--homocysteine methyltransferase